MKVLKSMDHIDLEEGRDPGLGRVIAEGTFEHQECWKKKRSMR